MKGILVLSPVWRGEILFRETTFWQLGGWFFGLYKPEFSGSSTIFEFCLPAL